MIEAHLNALSPGVGSTRPGAQRGTELASRNPFYTFEMVARMRTAVMWLLLLALPLQGLAAATMINCGPNHHRMSAAALAAPQAHDHAVSQAHQHHAIDMAADPRPREIDASENDGFTAHHLSKLAKFKCSACAACCMGAALPTAALVIASFPPAMTPAIFVSAPHVDFLADGLDRPPRPLLV